LSDELDWHFPHQDLLDAFGIIYPQYWKQPKAKRELLFHLNVLKRFYSHSKFLNAGLPLHEGETPYTASEMLSDSYLENQQGLFKLTMKANCVDAIVVAGQLNPVIHMWRTLSGSRHLRKLILEYFKVAEIGMCLVLGSVEDERCFSTLKFLKSY